MNYLEPNLVALSWFTLLWSVCCLGFLQLAGMYPLRAGGAGEARNPVRLVFGNTALWLALLAGTLAFAAMQLRWTTIVVVAGLLFLFIPELFQAIPARLHSLEIIHASHFYRQQLHTQPGSDAIAPFGSGRSCRSSRGCTDCASRGCSLDQPRTPQSTARLDPRLGCRF